MVVIKYTKNGRLKVYHLGEEKKQKDRKDIDSKVIIRYESSC